MDSTPSQSPPKVAICMPAYFAAKTLEATIQEIPGAGEGYDLILGDDCSTDGTAELAESLGIHVVRSEKNRGYGGNQKQIYQAALDRGADYIVMLHPDGQYDASLIPHFVGFLQRGVADFMLGNRIRTRRECLNCGMPVWKYFANRFLTIGENLVFGQNLGEFHSGFRAYRREVLEALPFHGNSEDFVFDSEFIAQAIYHGFRLADAPTPVRYFAEASSINFKRSMQYGLTTVGVAFKYFCARYLGLRGKIFRGGRSKAAG